LRGFQNDHVGLQISIYLPLAGANVQHPLFSLLIGLFSIEKGTFISAFEGLLQNVQLLVQFRRLLAF
jgi:hypothetical protein